MRVRAKTKINLDGKSVLELPLINDRDLKPGKKLAGPILIQGDYLTSIIDAGWNLRVFSNGDLFLESA